MAAKVSNMMRAFMERFRNQKMERMNGEVRNREKIVRGVKSVESPIFKGTQIFHNFIRPHMGLEGEKTPAEAAGIKVEGLNKWITLIQNASRTRSNQIPSTLQTTVALGCPLMRPGAHNDPSAIVQSYESKSYGQILLSDAHPEALQ